ncbi:MAG: hypothetical protein R3E01_08145 [Pirellulaceae bacterium]
MAAQTYFTSFDKRFFTPRATKSQQVIALASREGFEFSDDDYRAAVISGINAQPESAGDLAATYRRLVAEGRWFEVIDGVVVGG